MFGNLDIPTIVARAIVLLVAFTIHELAHAVTADSLGDPTPRRQGRITLNPIKHLDPIGTFLLLATGFGWAKPVMVNPYNLRGNPRTSFAIVAAAGPLSNIIMAILFALPIRFNLVGLPFGGSEFLPTLPFLLSQFVWINLILAFFNLIPVPPLDGYRILNGVLPADISFRLRPLEQYGFLILLGLIFFLPVLGVDVLGWLVGMPSSAVFRTLTGI